jgi:hypothetical protein
MDVWSGRGEEEERRLQADFFEEIYLRVLAVSCFKKALGRAYRLHEDEAACLMNLAK